MAVGRHQAGRKSGGGRPAPIRALCGLKQMGQARLLLLEVMLLAWLQAGGT